jgi:hypothetical protein
MILAFLATLTITTSLTIVTAVTTLIRSGIIELIRCACCLWNTSLIFLRPESVVQWTGIHTITWGCECEMVGTDWTGGWWTRITVGWTTVTNWII